MDFYRKRVVMQRKWLERKKLILILTATFMLAYCDCFERRKRRIWVKKWIARRKQQGVHHNLFMELALDDPEKFRRCLRMSTDQSQYLLDKVTPLIEKKNTRLRESIPASERLSLTLRHLATGETQESLHMTFRIGQSTISGIIKETVEAIYLVLKDEFLRVPATLEEWKVISSDIEERWNFPNCIGAIDGKHVNIEHPIKVAWAHVNKMIEVR